MGGVIAAGSPLSAAAGAKAFEAGGNAVDAAVAATFASFVAETLVVNIGGGGFAMVVDPNAPTPHLRATAYDFICSMPSEGDRAGMDFRRIIVDFGDDQQPFFIGRASSAVPGVVAGLCRMAAQRGRLPLSQLLAPAIQLAHDGYALLPQNAEVTKLLEPIYTDTAPLQQIFAPNNRLLTSGDHLRLPQLGETLVRLAGAPNAEAAAREFYQGQLAEKIVADQVQQGGWITAADLANYAVLECEPIRVDYRGYEVLLPPPASHGGVLIAFGLRLLNRLNLTGEGFGFHHIRTLAHVLRITSQARADWERDPSPNTARVAHFLSDEHVDHWWGRLCAAMAGDVPAGPMGPAIGPGHTSHISVMDNQGMAVSITTSAGEGAGYLVGDTGICLNNMLGELDLNPQGFHQDPPGARLRSMMSPAVVLRNGQPVLAIGSAGSNRLRSAILQSIVNVVDFHLSPSEAVSAPRIHYEAGVLHAEYGVEPNIIGALAGEGFAVKAWRAKSIFFGGAQAVVRTADGLAGGGDPRRGGDVA